MDAVEANLRQFRDFMLLYNSISESCFNFCITNFYDRKTSVNETNCIDRCVGKFMKVNHKIMAVYGEVQPIYMQKRIDEMMKQTTMSEEQMLQLQQIQQME